jgi:hypothetical protein
MSISSLLPENPLLAGLNGVFSVLENSATGQSHDGVSIVLSTTPLGNLVLPTGKLAVTDPFAEMTRGGNPGILLAPGSYKVWVTRAGFPDDGNLSPASHSAHPASMGTDGDGQTALGRNAYLTLVLDEVFWRARTSSPAKDSLRYFHLTLDGHPPAHVEEFGEGEFAGVGVSAGTCALVDDGALVDDMPPDVPGDGWADTVFDHGLDGSWFDAMDAATLYPAGCANLPLPLATTGPYGTPNIILAESGYGDGYYAVIGEYDPASLKNGHAPQLVAIHVDFAVVPRQGPVAQNSGPR